MKELIKQGNLSTLEEVVLQGFGDRLLGQTSTSPLVQDFLDKLPDYIVCIQLIFHLCIPLIRVAISQIFVENMKLFFIH